MRICTNDNGFPYIYGSTIKAKLWLKLFKVDFKEILY